MQVGDLVVCTTVGIVGKSIQYAHRRNEEVDWKRNHICTLNECRDGVWYVLQAEPKGITDDKPLATIAIGGTFETMTLPVSVDRDRFLEFQRSQLGHRYSYLSILSCALDMVLPPEICLRRSGTWICSGLVAASLWYAHFPPAKMWNDVYTITPAQLLDIIQKEIPHVISHSV